MHRKHNSTSSMEFRAVHSRRSATPSNIDDRFIARKRRSGGRHRSLSPPVRSPTHKNTILKPELGRLREPVEKTNSSRLHKSPRSPRSSPSHTTTSSSKSPRRPSSRTPSLDDPDSRIRSPHATKNASSPRDYPPHWRGSSLSDIPLPIPGRRGAEGKCANAANSDVSTLRCKKKFNPLWGGTQTTFDQLDSRTQSTLGSRSQGRVKTVASLGSSQHFVRRAKSKTAMRLSQASCTSFVPRSRSMTSRKKRSKDSKRTIPATYRHGAHVRALIGSSFADSALTNSQPSMSIHHRDKARKGHVPHIRSQVNSFAFLGTTLTDDHYEDTVLSPGSATHGRWSVDDDEKEKEEAAKKSKFLLPETHVESCALLASAVLQWKHKHRTNKKKDMYSTSVARNISNCTPRLVMNELSQKLEGVDLIRGTLRWICHNITALHDSPIPETLEWKRIHDHANRTMKKKQASAFEYAVLFAAMMDVIDIPCIIVKGLARHPKHYPQGLMSTPNHCWNIVRLPGSWKWRFVDVAMCSGSWQSGNVLDFTDAFFLTHPQQFILHHLPVNYWCPQQFEFEIKDTSRLQLFIPYVDRNLFWSFPLATMSIVEAGVFIPLKDFAASRVSRKSRMSFEIACIHDSEFDVEMTHAAGDQPYNDCVTVVHPSIEDKEKAKVFIFQLKVAFPTSGNYTLELLHRKVSDSSYEKHSLCRFIVKSSNGVLDQQREEQLAVGFLKAMPIFQEKIRDVVRNTRIVSPANSFHIIREPFKMCLHTSPAVTRIAYVSNVFWTFLKIKGSSNSEYKRFYNRVLIDKTASFAVYFEIDNRFVRAMEFRGVTKSGRGSPSNTELKSSRRAQHFLWDIKDVEKQKEAHKAITKHDGDCHMDVYGRCISAELQIARITKESYATIFELQCKKGWSLQAICYSGWHSRPAPLPAKHVSVDLLDTIHSGESHKHGDHRRWMVTLMAPEENGEARYSVQFNLALGDSRRGMFRNALTYYLKIKLGSPQVERFSFNS